jgi:hypothetical protein
MPHGIPGCIIINGQEYGVSCLGYLPPAPLSPVVEGYRFVKADGETYDVCLSHGRLECSCGDWIFRRSKASDPRLSDCKHCVAVRRHLLLPLDQARAAVPVSAGDYTLSDL